MKNNILVPQYTKEAVAFIVLCNSLFLIALLMLLHVAISLLRLR